MTPGEELERRARAAGLWCEGGPAHDGSRIGWMLCIEDGRARVWNRIPGVPVVSTWLAIPEATLLVQLAALPPRRCPACEGSKRQWSTADCLGLQEGWKKTDDCDDDGLPWWTRPCPTCTGPGEPVECGACDGGLIELRVTLDESRERAHLGQALALWLAGAPCGECEGSGRYYETITIAEFWARQSHLGRDTTYKVGTTHVDVDGPCPACEGHGTALARHLSGRAERAPHGGLR